MKKNIKKVFLFLLAVSMASINFEAASRAGGRGGSGGRRSSGGSRSGRSGGGSRSFSGSRSSAGRTTSRSLSGQSYSRGSIARTSGPRAIITRPSTTRIQPSLATKIQPRPIARTGNLATMSTSQISPVRKTGLVGAGAGRTNIRRSGAETRQITSKNLSGQYRQARRGHGNYRHWRNNRSYGRGWWRNNRWWGSALGLGLGYWGLGYWNWWWSPSFFFYPYFGLAYSYGNPYFYYPNYGFAFDRPLYYYDYPPYYHRYYYNSYDGSDPAIASILGIGVSIGDAIMDDQETD